MSALAASPSPPALADAPVPPAFAARASERLAHLLDRLRRRLLPAPAALLDLLTSQQVTTRAMTAAAELGIPDALAGGPLTVAALAAATGTEPAALARLLRLLVAAGVLRRTRDRYALTRLGRPLRTDAPRVGGGLGALSRGDWHWDQWGRLEHSVRTGETAQVSHHGEPFFSWFAGRPQEASVFDAAMDSVTAITTPAIAAACDLCGCRRRRRRWRPRGAAGGLLGGGPGRGGPFDSRGSGRPGVGGGPARSGGGGGHVRVAALVAIAYLASGSSTREDRNADWMQ